MAQTCPFSLIIPCPFLLSPAFPCRPILLQRQYVEERLRVLKWYFVGKAGKLILDEATSGKKLFENITLTDISTDLGDFNQLIEYSMKFTFPTVGANNDVHIARNLQFGSDLNLYPQGNGTTVRIAADNMVVEVVKDSTSSFKEVFRAAPIYIPGGPGATTLTVKNIRQRTYGPTAFERRKFAERHLSYLMSTHKDVERELIIDGESKGDAVLTDIQIGDLETDTMMSYSLVFKTGYAS